MTAWGATHRHDCEHGCACRQPGEPRCVLCVMLTTSRDRRPAAWAARWGLAEPFPATSWGGAEPMSEEQYMRWRTAARPPT